MLPLLSLRETERGLRVAMVDAGVNLQANVVVRADAHDGGLTGPLAGWVSARASHSEGRGRVAP